MAVHIRDEAVFLEAGFFQDTARGGVGRVGEGGEDGQAHGAGAVLDADKRVGDYHFGKEVTLFLSLKAGAAGADASGR